MLHADNSGECLIDVLCSVSDTGTRKKGNPCSPSRSRMHDLLILEMSYKGLVITKALKLGLFHKHPVVYVKEM